MPPRTGCPSTGTCCTASPAKPPTSYRGMRGDHPEALVHLQPPGVVRPVRADRFSPYLGAAGELRHRDQPEPRLRPHLPVRTGSGRAARLPFRYGLPRAAALDEAVAERLAGIAAWRKASREAPSRYGPRATRVEMDGRARGRRGRMSALRRRARRCCEPAGRRGRGQPSCSNMATRTSCGRRSTSWRRSVWCSSKATGFSRSRFASPATRPRPSWSDIRAGRTVPFTLGGSGQEPAPGPWARDGVAV